MWVLPPLMIWCHTQRPPAVNGMTALHHHQIHQVSWRRLVLSRQKKTIYREEHFVLHYSAVSIHSGHTCLKTEKTCKNERKMLFTWTAELWENDQHINSNRDFSMIISSQNVWACLKHQSTMTSITWSVNLQAQRWRQAIKSYMITWSRRQ